MYHSETLNVVVEFWFWLVQCITGLVSDMVSQVSVRDGSTFCGKNVLGGSVCSQDGYCSFLLHLCHSLCSCCPVICGGFYFLVAVKAQGPEEE